MGNDKKTANDFAEFEGGSEVEKNNISNLLSNCHTFPKVGYKKVEPTALLFCLEKCYLYPKMGFLN